MVSLEPVSSLTVLLGALAAAHLMLFRLGFSETWWCCRQRPSTVRLLHVIMTVSGPTMLKNELTNPIQPRTIGRQDIVCMLRSYM